MYATARANKPFGFKAVVVRDNGGTYQPARKNFATRGEAITYAQRWIDANRNGSGERSPVVMKRSDGY